MFVTYEHGGPLDESEPHTLSRFLKRIPTSSIEDGDGVVTTYLVLIICLNDQNDHINNKIINQLTTQQNNMRFNTATSLLALALKPVFSQGFNAASKPSSIRTATNLAARRSMFPMLRRSDHFFPDVEQMMKEFDAFEEQFPRPLSLTGTNTGIGDLKVTQDEKEYKVDMTIPANMQVEDIDLQLDHEGRVLTLKGNHLHEEEGMKIQSSFAKSILLSPEVDTLKLEANKVGDTLTVTAPKIEQMKALDKAEVKKIEIKVVPPAALKEGEAEEEFSAEDEHVNNAHQNLSM